MKRIIFLSFILLFQISIFAQEETQTETQTEIPTDTLLKRQLESIRIKDQALRMLLPDVETKFGEDSPELAYFWTLVLQQDSINENEVIQIIDNYGWLGANRVGEMANRAMWLVIQHAPIKTQEKYLPLLKESVEKEESPGWHLALLEDRILMRNGEKQVYGSQATYNAGTGKMHIYPIADVSAVNERRQKLGLQSIEEYAKQFGYIFDQAE